MKPMLVVGLALVLAGCGNSRAADSVAAAVRALPGVSSAQSDYHSRWNGDSRFTLAVVLDPAATPAEAAAVGQTFSDLVDKNGLVGAHAGLDMDYPATRSSAEVALAENPSAPTVSESLRDWLAVAQSPGVSRADLAGNLTVTVGPFATDSDLRVIAQKRPDVTWQLIGRRAPGDSASPADRNEIYEVRGMVPDDGLRRTWDAIVSKLGGAGQVTARTDPSATPPTTVTVNIPDTYRDHEQNLAQAWMTFPLLERLPLPARVEFGGDIFTVGGCTPPDPSHAATKLEAELRSKFEKC